MAAAWIIGARAARGEGTADRQRLQIGRRTADGRQPLAAHPGMHGGAQQAVGIGVARRAHHLAHTALLHDPPGIHHRNSVGDLPRHAEIMGDEDDAHPEFLLQAAQQQQDLDLHRCVQRRRRLVGEQQFRPAGKCDGDHRALAQTAGEFMRIGRQPALGRRDLHKVEQFQRPLARGVLGDAFMADDGFGNLLADGEHRVQRRHRLLKHHRHLTPAQLGQIGLAGGDDVVPTDVDRTTEHGFLRRVEAHQRTQRDRFAGAGFTEDAQHLARIEIEAHPVDRVDLAIPRDEANRQIPHFDQGAHVACST